MGRKSALRLGQPRLPGRQTAVGNGDWGSLPATKLCGELWCPSARCRHCQRGRMWKGEEEIGVGWRGDCATQVELDRCWVPAWLLLTTLVQGKTEVLSCAASSGELEFPWQPPGSKPPTQWPKPALRLSVTPPGLFHPPRAGGPSA